jgi:hypothetical protein
MEDMVFTNVQYRTNEDGDNSSICFTLDGKFLSVAVGSVGNRHYDEIMRQVNAGTLTIQDAD